MRLALRLLAAGAFAVSAYLAWAALAEGGVAGCGPESGCDKVLSSRWSSWLGIPVSLPALAVYAAVIAATFWLAPHAPVARQRVAWWMLVASAAAILGAVIWFVVLQLAVMRSICPYCMAAHALGALAAVLILLHAPFQNPQGKPWKVEKLVFIRPGSAWKLVGAAGGGVVVLAGGQLLHTPRQFAVATLDSGPSEVRAETQPAADVDSSRPASHSPGPPASAQASSTRPPLMPGPVPAQAAPTIPARYLGLYGGAITLNLAEVPLIGKPDAPFVMVSLYDYSCHHCRLMHGHLQTVQRLLSNHVAIASLPMPLDPKCNYTVRRPHPDHVNACAYARTGLAVWRASREKLMEFDEWMFTPDRPPPPEQVTRFAEQLVGSNALHQALDDPWIDGQLRQGIDIYATNTIHFRQGSMPQVIIGSNVVVGTVSGPQDLLAVLAKQTGLQMPAVPPAANAH